MKHEFDLLLGDDDDLLFENGDLAIGDSLTQEIGIIIRLNQGELKSDPLLGPNLISRINGKANPTEVQTVVKVHLARDGKDYDDVKSTIGIKSNNL